MLKINKVPTSAGTQWLKDGFVAFGRAPLRLGLLSASWAVITFIFSQIWFRAPGIGILLQVLAWVAAPVFFAVLVHEVRVARLQKTPEMGTPFSGFEKRQIPNLLMLLLPQILLGILAAILLIVLLGGMENVRQLMEVISYVTALASAGQPVDPEILAQIPGGQLLIWMLVILAAAFVTSLLWFAAVPEILFGKRDGISAMRNSLNACIQSFGAVMWLQVLLMLVFFAVAIAAAVVTGIVVLIFGPFIAALLSQVLITVIIMPLTAGSVESAWRSLLSDVEGEGGASAPPSTPNTFIA